MLTTKTHSPTNAPVPTWHFWCYLALHLSLGYRVVFLVSRYTNFVCVFNSTSPRARIVILEWECIYWINIEPYDNWYACDMISLYSSLQVQCDRKRRLFVVLVESILATCSCCNIHYCGDRYDFDVINEPIYDAVFLDESCTAACNTS